MVRLGPTVDDFDCDVFAKIEFFNPMGSVKDRIARYMIEKAIAEGRLEPGDLVVENSSGNTAMGLAMMSVLHDLRCSMVVRRQTSREKLDCLRAMGIDLVLVDGDLPPEDPESYNQKAREIAASTVGAYFPDQHNNRENSEAHYHTTGPEIWSRWTVGSTIWWQASAPAARSAESPAISRGRIPRSRSSLSIPRVRCSTTTSTAGATTTLALSGRGSRRRGDHRLPEFRAD